MNEKWWQDFEALINMAKFVSDQTECDRCAVNIIARLTLLNNYASFTLQELNNILCKKCETLLQEQITNHLNELKYLFSGGYKEKRIAPAWKAKPSIN